MTNLEELPNLSLPHVSIAIDSNGQPSTNATFTVYGNRFIEDWCSGWPTGCMGGQYLAHIKIII